MVESSIDDRVIKEFKYWSVFIHENQSYLGRCVVWCKREDAIDLTDASESERIELFEILDMLKKACDLIFKPDLLNYAFLGNVTRHLHCHFVPRYSKTISFQGVEFSDSHWGDNFQTDWLFKVPSTVLYFIRDKYRERLS